MSRSSTRDALLRQGALLFARHGVADVTTRQLHEAIGARNESALHYHFGGKDGLVEAILRGHLEAVEARRAPLVAAVAADDLTADPRALVHALAAPMDEDLGTELGRAHLRIVARLSYPSLAYRRPFRIVDAPAGLAVVRWLHATLEPLPRPLRLERLAMLRSQLISLFGLRAQLLDESAPGEPPVTGELFFGNLLDMLVAGLTAPASRETLAAIPAE
ncbi:TetR/AcrR family transcriptional regulator [Nonomuraea ferruginea]|uniref:TetR family transcriptional regulator n=1 Tax=Nonomuraea ferruginea TaxID=46174 RepID=A0ABT4T9Q0_9ACTN|nr:TetR family transcriptional regulator [Nonomuraea ferruginea]MDA0646180.1 TetR family transcriptional regulator [Nonomuraea ferruginea]